MSCSITAKKLCDKDCETCFVKSFASHPKVNCWSSKNAKQPRQVFKGSEQYGIFNCDKCNHEFKSKIYNVLTGYWCPYCKNKKLCDKDCETCFVKSFASHPKVNCWSSKNAKQPRQVFKGSEDRYIFNCDKCKHENESHVYNVLTGYWCPYCKNQKLCDKDCETCFTKSFASHPKVNCWSSKNTKQPREIFKGSEQRGIFNCDKCNSEFDAKIYNVLTGYWCPYCKNKSEAKMLEFLSKYPTCKKQLRFEWCKFSKTGHIMPFDFGINKVLIELDGEQHFIQISNWDTPENVQAKDKEKIQKCMEQGYSIIHISQLDVWYDTYDWKTVIQEEITLLQDQPSTCVFISSQDIYENHCIGIENCKLLNPLKKPEI